MWLWITNSFGAMMKSLMFLMQSVLADASIWCCTSATRDLNTIQRRVEHEGVSFLTITLPSFARDLERALDQGGVATNMFLSFSKHGRLPRFLGGFSSLVFDRSSGLLLDEPSKEAIYFLRQITLMFKKILLPCSKERERSAFDGYIKCESEVATWSANCPDELLARFGHAADQLWGTVLSPVDLMVYEQRLVPKHGPGSTADRLFGNEKFRLRTWNHRLEKHFPALDYLSPNMGFSIEDVNFTEPVAESPVRVISVPKTLKTPRIIAIEPTCMQYTQQALLEVLVEALESSDFLSGALGFTDQAPNQRLACSGSRTGMLATLDLSEASDRVSNLLVKRMLRNFPSLAEAVQDSRSLRADVPGHGVIPLTKFASMGSATTFPIEAMVFLTIVFSGYLRQLNRQPTQREIKSFLGRVRIYGDDIIVPVNIVRSTVEELETFGLKVNSHKSFWTGKFRESCGRDYYDGVDVSCVYVRRVFPKRRSDVSEFVSLVSLRNQFYKAGLWKTVQALDCQIQKLAPFPYVSETSPVLGRHSYMGYEVQRTCRKLHSPLVKGMVLRPKPRRSPLDGEGALLKFFLKRGLDPIFDPKHLERYGRPESVDMKIRWASAA